MPTVKYDGLPAGLRVNRRVPVNTLGWSQYQNLRATDWGAVDFHAITNAIDPGVLEARGNVEWPYPQLFIGRTVTLLCYEDAIYLDGSDTPLELKNAHDIDGSSASLRPVAPGGVWQFVDFWDTWLLFNGACVVFKTNFIDDAWIVTTDDETLTNGDFDGDATGWTLGGSWFYSDGGIAISLGGVASAAMQEPADQVDGKKLEAGREYEITVTLSDVTAGVVNVHLVGGGGQVLSEDGTHTFRAVAGTPRTLALSADTAFVGKVDAVSCRRAGTTVRAGANWNDGRVVLAGFDPTNYHNMVDWPGELASYRGSAPSEIQSALTAVGRAGAGQNWAWWSSIGGEDLLRLWSLKALKYASLGAGNMGFDNDRPFYLDLLHRAEFGLAPLSWPGEVSAAAQLGRHMALYGTGHAGAALLVDGGEARVALDDIHGLGQGVCIANRGAVAGGPARHILLDRAGGLWQVAPEQNTARAVFLDRQEFLGELDLDVARVVHEPYHNEFYIGDGDDAYLLSEDGAISRAPWMPTSVHFTAGAVQGITFAADEPVAVVLETLPFSSRLFGGQAGHPFTLQRVRLETTDIDAVGWSVEVGMRVRNSHAWHWFPAVTLGAVGVADMEISGVEAKVRLTHPNRANTTGISGVYLDGNLDGPFNSEAWLAVTQTQASIP